MDALSIKRVTAKIQTPASHSFSGGNPNIPADVPWPDCQFCGRPQTFFFQLRFPEAHPWFGKTLAVFHCVECCTAETSFPKFVRGTENIFTSFFDELQTNVKLIVFNSDVKTALRTEYAPRIQHQVFKLNPMKRDIGYHTKVGGSPIWGAGLSHNCYIFKGQEMAFLLQITREYTFPRLPDAPPQRKPPFIGRAWVRELPNYTLFELGAPLYFFGTANPDQKKVLVEVGK